MSRVVLFGVPAGRYDSVPRRRPDHPIKDVEEDGRKNGRHDNIHVFIPQELLSFSDVASLWQIGFSVGFSFSRVFAIPPVFGLSLDAGRKRIKREPSCLWKCLNR